MNSTKIMNDRKIEIRKEWLLDLMNLAAGVESSEGLEKRVYEARLMGFIRSAKYLVDNGDR